MISNRIVDGEPDEPTVARAARRPRDRDAAVARLESQLAVGNTALQRERDLRAHLARALVAGRARRSQRSTVGSFCTSVAFEGFSMTNITVFLLSSQTRVRL